MSGRVVAITGGFGALGRAVAIEAAGRGWSVAALDFSPAPPSELEAALASNGLALGRIDLTKADDARRAIETVIERFGRLDALLNIAGGFVWQTLADGDPAAWSRMFTLNVETAANASRAALPHLIRSGSGRIVNIGANGALNAAAGMGAYAASKAGVHKLTESLAQETKGQITVNAVLPSIIDTPANRKDMPDADYALWVSPKALANVLLFLASEEASAVTGALIPVTGGV
ncbi:MAG TPA: SDR family NAD(P)-dependent oxidoreductase [Caulobacteraceae bacterium]|jgi:NAD(P)-dependent dehydrogenase (short-subunit alcohol dehydrogenase family)